VIEIGWSRGGSAAASTDDREVRRGVVHSYDDFFCVPSLHLRSPPPKATTEVTAPARNTSTAHAHGSRALLGSFCVDLVPRIRGRFDS
jgi:hypothetical protein